MGIGTAIKRGCASGRGYILRSLQRNQQPVFFKKYLGNEEILDEYGNLTGTYAPKYSELMSSMMTVSPNKGNSEVEMFGTLEDYDRTASTSNTSIAIDENSILWIDNADTMGPHNYIVKLRSPWKNSVAFALKRVEVSYANNQGET